MTAIRWTLYNNNVKYIEIILLTNVMSFIKNNHGTFAKFFRDQIGYFWIQQIMITVHHHICMNNLKDRFRIRIIDADDFPMNGTQVDFGAYLPSQIWIPIPILIPIQFLQLTVGIGI